MENTLNNISEKSKIIFIDGIPDKKKTNTNDNIVEELSNNYKNAVFFTDDSNVPENQKGTGNNREYYNIWKGGKRYTKFQDVVDGNFISIGSHKIYLKNNNGFLYLVQGKDIEDLEINSVHQQVLGNVSESTTNIVTNINENNNEKYYEPTYVEINSTNNLFKVKYTVKLKQNLLDENNNTVDDNSGDKSLKFRFFTKENGVDYLEANNYVEFVATNSSLTDELYCFRCLNPTSANNPLYIQAISNYDETMYCYYPFVINVNIQNIIFRKQLTGEIIFDKTLYMTVGEKMNISYEFYPAEANNTYATYNEVNADYCAITMSNENKYFSVDALKPTSDLAAGYTGFNINVGNTINRFKLYIKQITQYYWYIGTTNPIETLNNMQTQLPVTETSKYSPGFHVFNENINYDVENPLIDAEYNPIKFGELTEYYILLPNGSINDNNDKLPLQDNDFKLRHEIYDAFGGDNSTVYEIINDNYIFNNISYTLYKSIVPATQFNGKIF